jgi:toxin ParE1/3/4
MAGVLFSGSAENDLLEAWLYIADNCVSAADRMLDQIEAEAMRLLDQPMMGRERRELAEGLRTFESFPGH